jgi:hypothetical protein
MKKILLFFLVLGVIGSAAGFEASLQSQKEEANLTSPAKFDVTIQNDDAVNHSYSTSLLSPKSSWFYYPSTVRVPAGENRTFTVTVSPVKNALQQRYRFDMTVREQNTGDVRELTGFFRVEQPYRLQITDMSLNREEFRPGEVIQTQIRIKNLHNEPVSDYSVEARYHNHTRTETGTSILPGGERLYSFSFRVDEDASPGRENISYAVNLDGQTERTAVHEITVSAVENVSRSSNVDNRILTYSETRTVRNTGNSQANTSVTAEVPSYLASITSTGSEPSRIEKVSGNTVYVWETSLEPGEEYTAGYTVKYWIPLLGVILLTAGIVAIKRIGQQVYLEKTAEEIDGEIKVNIEVQNSGETGFEELELEEFIPDIATVDESFDMNTPEIRKTGEGTKLTWKVKDLQPGDQRIIQYRIKPKVQVEEEVELEPAVIKDENGQRIAESNRTSAEFTPDTT